MRNNLRKITLLSMALFLSAVVISAARGVAAAEAAQDSEHISELLQQVKEHTAQLTRDAEELVAFQKNSRVSWESHAGQIEKIKEHVNNVGKLEEELRDAREEGSPWQQQAIDRVNPLLQEMADNLESTIDHFNNNKGALFTPPYAEYVRTNADLAASLHSLISNFVSYGKTKQKFESLQQKLEVAES